MTDHFLIAYSHWLVNIGFIAGLLFVPLNSIWWPWWQEVWGWNIVTLELCIAGDLLSSVLYIDFGISSLFLQWAEIVSLTLTVAVIFWRSALIWKTQRAATRKRAEPARLPEDCPG